MLSCVFLGLSVLRQCLSTRNAPGTDAENAIEAPPTTKDYVIFKITYRVLTQVFGGEAILLICKYLKRRYSLSESEFLERIDMFARELKDFLSSGAYVVESIIFGAIYFSYNSLRGTELERTHEKYDFTSQIRIDMHKA